MTLDKTAGSTQENCDVCGILAIVTLTSSGLGPASIVRCKNCLEKGAEPFGLAAIFFGNYGLSEANYMKTKLTWADEIYLSILEASEKYPKEFSEIYETFLDEIRNP